MACRLHDQGTGCRASTAASKCRAAPSRGCDLRRELCNRDGVVDDHEAQLFRSWQNPPSGAPVVEPEKPEEILQAGDRGTEGNGGLAVR